MVPLRTAARCVRAAVRTWYVNYDRSLPFPIPRHAGERPASIAGDRAEAGDGEVQQAPGGHGDVHHRAEKGHQGSRRHVSGESY